MAVPLDARRGSLQGTDFHVSSGASRLALLRETFVAEPLDRDRLIGLVVGSFAVSQGDENLQRMVFDFYHFLRTDLRISFDLFNETVDPLTERVANIVDGGTHKQLRKQREEIDETTIEQLEIMRNRLSRPAISTANGEILTLDIAREVIVKDFSYLCMRPEGRPVKQASQADTYNPFLDPYLSYITYFALEQDEHGNPRNKQRVPEIGVLYEIMGEVVRTQDLLSFFVSKLGSSLPEVKGSSDKTYHARKALKKFNVPVFGDGIHPEEDEVEVRDLLSVVRSVHDNRPQLVS